MIARAGVDLVRAVDLLEQHHPRQMVREGHGRHGKAQVGALLHARVQAGAAADEKGQLRSARGGELRQLFREGFAAQLRALDAQGDDRAALGELFLDERGLPGERLLDLGGIIICNPIVYLICPVFI